MNVPELINEICPSCNPTSYNKTVARFISEIAEEENEYLYQCTKCEAKLWVDAQWANKNAVKAE